MYFNLSGLSINHRGVEVSPWFMITHCRPLGTEAKGAHFCRWLMGTYKTLGSGGEKTLAWQMWNMGLSQNRRYTPKWLFRSIELYGKSYTDLGRLTFLQNNPSTCLAAREHEHEWKCHWSLWQSSREVAKLLRGWLTPCEWGRWCPNGICKSYTLY